ncbi:MAG: hypothetical protein F4Z83_07575 [Gemmatimonadetes bacterium]|nr:hypothetical protein [Gemmatimonadota bacterium]
MLRRLGCDLVAAQAPTRPRRPLCCGRTWISAGLLDHARAEVRRTLDALVPLVRQGIPIVGLEPSCLLTLRDEALHLCPGEDARLVAGHAFLADEFLASRFAPSRAPHGAPAGDPGAPPAEIAAGAEVRIHGHCHQKASGTEAATADALAALLPGTAATPIQSSCCGMAGSFGYTARHLRTSRAMGELGLFPALRAAAPSDIVVANGFSCRAQIHAGTGRRARHVMEVLAERMELTR